MIVDYLNVEGVIPRPHETDSPLLVDSDAVLALSVTPKQFQPISRNGLQVCEAGRAVNHLKFSHGGLLNALKPQHSPAIEQRLRFL
jgi:hypothetical protein